jgi:hypothetical protein
MEICQLFGKVESELFYRLVPSPSLTVNTFKIYVGGGHIHTTKHNTVACRAVSRQRLATHVPAAEDTHATIQVLSETMFSTRSVQRGYKDNWSKSIAEPAWRRGRIPPPWPCDEKRSLKSETIKYGLKSQGTWTRERLRWQGPAAHTKDRSDLSSERAPHKNNTVTVTQIIQIWS